MTTPSHGNAGGPAPYEERDVAILPIALTGIALFAIIVATFVIVRFVDTGLTDRLAERSKPASPLAATYGEKEPPAPRLQSDPRSDLAALRARETAQLEGYGWIDKQAGRVHIPVDRAMALVAEDGTR
jgi:hypothetical protein